MSESRGEEGGRGPVLLLALVTLVLFTDMVVYDLVIPILPDYTRSWGMNATELGLLFGAYAAALLLSVPFAGRLCDRLGVVRAMQLGVAGLFLSQLLYVAARGRALLFAARALQGFAGGTAWAAGMALLALSFPPSRRGRALGMAM